MDISFQNENEIVIAREDYNKVLDFWFANQKKWFQKSEEFDDQIRNKFLPLYEMAICGNLKHWEDEPHSMLALIIMLDQFSRNMFRNTEKAFQADDIAIKLTKKSIKMQYEEHLQENEIKFLYMPLMHSENINDQDLFIQLYNKVLDEQTLNYAKAHRKIILKFGRFPHRNIILNRESTEQEIEFLKQPGSSF